MILKDELFSIVSQTNDVIRLCLNPEHTIYRAHFPGNPITPGVCLIQIVGELLQIKFQIVLDLKKVVNLKFVSTISPIEQQVIDIKFTQIANETKEVKAKGYILSADNVMTKFSLVFEKR